MYYEINIVLNGKHLFATHERSMYSMAEMKRVFDILDAKFPEEEGYSLSVNYHPGISYGSSRQAIKEAIAGDKLSEHFLATNLLGGSLKSKDF